MKVILWMGMSLNGYIAGEDSTEDFISEDCWHTWVEELKKHGCVIFGRKTHQNLITWSKRYIKDLEGIKIIVVSNNLDYKVSSDFKLVNSPQAAIDTLEKQGFSSIVLTGGST